MRFQKGRVLPLAASLSRERLWQSVLRLITYRPFRLQAGGPHHLVFIDARTLGKLICCRLCSQTVLRVEDLLEALDLQLSSRFTVRFFGSEADPVDGDPLVRKVMHCSSVTLGALMPRRTDRLAPPKPS